MTPTRLDSDKRPKSRSSNRKSNLFDPQNNLQLNYEIIKHIQEQQARVEQARVEQARFEPARA